MTFTRKSLDLWDFISEVRRVLKVVSFYGHSGQDGEENEKKGRVFIDGHQKEVWGYVSVPLVALLQAGRVSGEGILRVYLEGRILDEKPFNVWIHVKTVTKGLRQVCITQIIIIKEGVKGGHLAVMQSFCPFSQVLQDVSGKRVRNVGDFSEGVRARRHIYVWVSLIGLLCIRLFSPEGLKARYFRYLLISEEVVVTILGGDLCMGISFLKKDADVEAIRVITPVFLNLCRLNWRRGLDGMPPKETLVLLLTCPKVGRKQNLYGIKIRKNKRSYRSV